MLRNIVSLVGERAARTLVFRRVWLSAVVLTMLAAATYGQVSFRHAGDLGGGSYEGIAFRFAEGDINNDGINDYAYTINNFGPRETIFLRLGTGSGTAAGTNLVTDGYKGDLKFADLDRDGKLDILYTGYDDGTLRTRRGNGDGTFAAEVIVGVAAAPVNNVFILDLLQVGDLDGDGFIDAVTATRNSGVRVSFGNGDGTFSRFIATDNLAGVASLAVLDIDNDGGADVVCMTRFATLDLVTLTKYRAGLPILDGVNLVPGGLPADSFLAVARSPNGAVFAAVEPGTPGRIVMGRNPGGNPTDLTVIPGYINMMRPGIADFDGDGVPDLAINEFQTNTAPPSAARILKGSPSGAPFGSVIANFITNSSTQISPANFNNDGRPDIIMTGAINQGSFLGFSVFTNLLPGLVVTTAVDEDNGNTVVTNGTGASLREAINYAQQLNGPQTISFAPNLGNTVSILYLDSDLTVGRTASNDPITIENNFGTVFVSGRNTRRVLSVAPNGKLNLRNLMIADGKIDTPGIQAGGAGLLIGSGATVSVENCTFSKNISNSSSGSAIWADAGSNVTIRNSTFNSNTGKGTIGSMGSLTIEHATVSGNSGNASVGGILMANPSSGTANLLLRNSVVAANGGDDLSNSGANVSGTNNILSVGANGNGLANTIFADPLIDIPANNGGRTRTMKPQPNSPMINAGAAIGVATDQRGVARSDGAPDIGSFEANAFTPILNHPFIFAPNNAGAATLNLNQVFNPTPAGGVFTGSGVSSGIFNPAGQTPGDKTITYTIPPQPNYDVTNRATAKITVFGPPTVTTNPADRSAIQGDTVSFSALATGIYAGSAPNSMASGDNLLPGQFLLSDNRGFQLVYQGDGNLVLYRAGGGALWASNTATMAPGFVAMQGDGNLVIYNSLGHAQFSTNTAGNPGARLLLQGDGNLVIYSAADAPIYATNSAISGTNPTASVQWQVSTNGGSSYTDIPGASNPTLTVGNVTTAEDNKRFRAVFTNAAGSTPTGSARLGVVEPNLTVDTINDDPTLNACTNLPNDCSLRGAIDYANTHPENDTINFDSTIFANKQTITLTNGQLSVANNGSVTLNGIGVDKVIVSGNDASRVFEVAPGATLVLIKMTVTGGRDVFGGGINNHGTLALNTVKVTGNTATGGGGGINSDTGTVTNISNSAITNNTSANNAGGLYFYNAATVNIFNATISGNTAGNFGGGITNEGGTIQMTNATVANNTAAFGGGVYNFDGSTIFARNDLIASNSAGTAPDFSGTLTSQAFNLIGNNSGLTVAGSTTGDIFNVDPKLLPLSNYGGETPTVALLPGSPAINAGTAENVPDIDQRGRARVGATDIGAYEAAGTNLVVTNTANSGAGSLPAAFAAANATTADETITFAIPSNDAGCVNGVCTINLNGGLNAGAAATSGNLIVSNQTGAANLIISANQQGRVITSNGGNLAINGLTLTGGRLPNNGQGGGIYSTGTLIVMNSALTGNSRLTSNQGGGIYNEGGLLTVVNSTISDSILVNNNTKGGGIYNNGSLTIANSTISGNTATDGAGIFNTGSGIVNAANVNVTINFGDGGGIYNDSSGRFTIRNAIIANNYLGTGSDLKGSFHSSGYNLISRFDLNTSTITGDQTGNIVGAFNSPIDVKIAPLGFYGGTTMTHALLAGSPAINAGTPTGSPQADQRGASRIGAIDIGSFELNSSQNGGNFRAALSNGRVGQSYSQTLVPERGATAYCISSGALPNGLSGIPNCSPLGEKQESADLAPTAAVTISGTPMQGGTFNFAITATYSGSRVDTDYALTIEKANSTITINSANPNPSNAGQTITVAFTVAPQFGGTPTGNVTVTDGVDNCTATAASGQCSLALNTAGNRVLTAAYIGDANFNGGVSAGLSHTVVFIMPLTLTVDTISDDGSLNACTAAASDCSLRGAVNRANDNPESDTINFDSSVFAYARTITLTNGQLSVANNGTLTINGTRADRLSISGNNASRVFEVSSGANLGLLKMTVSGGREVFGGGINNHGTLTLNTVNVTGNTATGGGGGINSDTGTLIDISNSAITNNISASNAGGLYFYNAANVTIFNTTVSNNTAGNYGGGITNEFSTIQMTNATVAHNTSAFGGGVYNFDGSTIYARNDLIAGNAAGTAPDFSGTLTSQAFNLIGSTSGATIAGDTTGNLLNVDPKLLFLSNYGGETLTVALLPDSPAVNAGTAENVPDIDQRGRARVGATDIGAYEAAGTNLVVTNTANSGAGSLPAAFAAANATTADETITFAIPSNDAGCVNGVCTINLNGGLDVSATTGGLIVSNQTSAANLIISANQQGRPLTSNGGNLAINGLTLTGGQVGLNGHGSGIYSSGSLTVMNSTITGNVGIGGSQGGGIFNDAGLLTIVNSTISNNTTSTGSSSMGGGIFNDNGPLTITNSTISGNYASKGGGIYSPYSPYYSPGTLTNVTVTGNSANSGGGIFNNASQFTIRNAIIAGNSASIGIDLYGSFDSRGYNLIGKLEPNFAGISGDQTGNLIGTNASPVDPKLAPLGFYGGKTMTYALLANSPAINAGTSAGSPFLDQRGATRIGATDIGAFELNSSQNGGNFIAKLPGGQTNQPYLQTLVPETGAAVYCISAGNLPNGLSGIPACNQPRPEQDQSIDLVPNAALTISGTPTLGGTFSFAISATSGGSTNVTNYTVNILGPTAANVSVSGRVLTGGGRGLVNAIATMTDSNGNIRTARTNNFGNFRFNELGAGQIYIIEVRSKQYTFAPQVISVNEDLTEVNFTAQ